MSEPLLVGWVSIHKLFCDSEGNSIMSINTLRQLYGRELQELGIVFRWKMGSGKRPVVACWPSKVRNWWTLKQKQKWKKKNN